jgi:hypothetical protein
MMIDDIKKVLALCVDSICDDCPYADTKDCYNQIKLDARDLIIKQESEIEKLKAENIRLTTKLGQVLLSIDTVKEMNTMCSIDEQRKQAKIDVLNELKEKCKFDGHTVAVYKNDIDDMIVEVEKCRR